MLNSKMLDRVDDRIRHRRCRRDRACLAGTLGAHRVDRRWSYRSAQLVRRDHACSWHSIVIHRSGDQLTVIVVMRPFIERLGEALGNAAMDLTVDDQWVEHVANVI